jgi:hypothetical protein
MTEESAAASLARRVGLLEARAGVIDMHHRYLRLLPERRFDELIDYFADDAVIDMRTHGVSSGREEIAEHFSHMVNSPLTGATYLLTMPIIDVVDERHATGIWAWHRLYSEAEVGGARVTNWGVWDEGRYDCEYRLTERGWLFSSMHFRIVRPVPDDPPTAG